MIFTDDFLCALANWQKGWRENQEKRKTLSIELEKHCLEIPDAYKKVKIPCYRKRFLHSNELIDIIMNNEKKEGITSWTTNDAFAERFKGIFREDAVTAAIFKHFPNDNEVVINISSLWESSEFVKTVKGFQLREPEKSKPLFHFKNCQSEVILNVPLRGSEIIALTGISSPFDELCDIAQIPESKRDSLYKEMIEKGDYIGEPRYAPEGSAQRIISKIIEQMQEFNRKNGLI